jgi:hypothetical protein
MVVVVVTVDDDDDDIPDVRHSVPGDLAAPSTINFPLSDPCFRVFISTSQ